jgi:mono/diheme cytochrome c family protein
MKNRARPFGPPLAARFAAIVLAGLFAPGGAAWAQSRGELLYTTHCIACHSTQMHWREQRRATDLASLEQQVRLWQRRALLSWTDDDIAEVTRYLNESIYRFGQTTARASRTEAAASRAQPTNDAGAPTEVWSARGSGYRTNYKR